MKNKITISVDEELYEWIVEMAEREDKKVATMVTILLDRLKLMINVKKKLEK